MRCVLIAAVVLSLAACDGDPDCPADRVCPADPECPAGTERCPCYGNSTCNDGLVCGSDLCVSLSGGDPLPGDPTAGDPLAGDPIAGDPLPGDPTAGDPLAGDPIAGDPLPGDPTAGDPLAGDPIAGDSIAGDPIAGDPLVGDPIAGDPTGGDDFGGDPVVDPCVGDVAYDDFSQCVRESICAWFARCLRLPPEDCLPLEITVFGIPLTRSEDVFRDAIAAGKMTYDGVAASECFPVVEARSCLDPVALSGPFDPCGIFTGTVAPGGVCFHELECALVGSKCDIPSCDQACCPAGTCFAPALLGQGCTSDGDCTPGAQCVASICETGDAGSPCTSDSHCNADYWCNGISCAVDRAPGAVCADDDECPLDYTCIGNDLQGGSGFGICGRVDSAGASCDGQCNFFAYYCDQPDPAILGTCRLVPTLGESCLDAPNCVSFYQCDTETSVCVENGAVGSPCTSSSDCDLGLFCDTEITGIPAGSCMARSASGVVCTRDTHCLSSLCVSVGGGTFQCSDHVNCY